MCNGTDFPPDPISSKIKDGMADIFYIYYMADKPQRVERREVKKKIDILNHSNGITLAQKKIWSKILSDYR